MKTIQVSKMAGEHPLDTVARMVGSRAVLADYLKVTPAAIGNWKLRGVPIEKCPEIERFGCPAATRRDLRPNDWEKIWPELAESPEFAVHVSTQRAVNQPDTLREGTVRRHKTRRAGELAVLLEDRRSNDAFAQPPCPMPAQEV
jgi:DNA-binding transcriptional regulator YdaS (Cro superfamily)